jgi:hypothetical protein
VQLRTPVAILAAPEPQYVDSKGVVFGDVTLHQLRNVPVIQGVQARDEAGIQRALKMLELWAESSARGRAELMSIDEQRDQGFRLWITYRLHDQNRLVRSRVYLPAHLISDAAEGRVQLSRLNRVIELLTQRSTTARQIYADAGKKIVVKIAHGS